MNVLITIPVHFLQISYTDAIGRPGVFFRRFLADNATPSAIIALFDVSIVARPPNI